MVISVINAFKSLLWKITSVNSDKSLMNGDPGGTPFYYMSTEIYAKQSCQIKMVCQNLETI